jgi:hypothetical protein
VATEMNPPNSDAVVFAADDVVETYKAAGFTEAKAKRHARKADDK